MSGLPGYDDWKTHNPDDDRCEFCGVHPRECRGGWQPDRCTGECGKGWRDPDAEYDRQRDDRGLQPMKYEIGQQVWVASFEAQTVYVVCPDCAGTGRVRVMFADDTLVSIECEGCRRGYDPPDGHVRVYDRQAIAILTRIKGVEVGAKTEWRTEAHYCVEEENLFDNEADCLARAKEMAAEFDRADREKVNQKEKPTKSWGWHAHYHRKEIKDAQRKIEYHTKKLAVANLKAKERPAAQPLPALHPQERAP